MGEETLFSFALRVARGMLWTKRTALKSSLPPRHPSFKIFALMTLPVVFYSSIQHKSAVGRRIGGRI